MVMCASLPLLTKSGYKHNKLRCQFRVLYKFIFLLFFFKQLYFICDELITKTL